MAMFTIGNAEVDTALELEINDNPIAWLGVAPEVVDANRWWMAPDFLGHDDTWSMNFRSWIVRVDDKVVIVDPCTGNGRPNASPEFDMLDTPFLSRLESAGTAAEDVDYVFCTHMHHDHCGWNTTLRDGRWVPTFPNARYMFVEREYLRWRPENADKFTRLAYNDGVYERSIAPIVSAGLADVVPDTHRLTPSLLIEPAPGHTAGHSMLSLASGGSEAVFCGDAFHHPLQLVKPELMFGDFDDRDAAIETRRRLVRRSLERDLLLIPAHMPFPYAGRMRRTDGRGLSFEPLLALPR